MELSNYYKNDIKKFEKRQAKPINCKDWHNDLVPKTLKIGKKLFHNTKTEEAFDGSILIDLDNGKLLALVCLPKQDLNASATLVGNTYFIAINFSVIQILFNLSFSIWRNNYFLSHINPYFKEKSIINSELIPPGFENIFLYSKFKLSEEIKNEIFYRCFEQAISFFWLHEIGHVFAGHIDACIQLNGQINGIDEYLNIIKLDKKNSKKTQKAEIPYVAFEIQADRWASDRIFERLHENIFAGSGFEAELISTIIGCTLFPLSLHGYNLLRKEKDLDKYHPPLWFRADEIIKAEDRAANKQWFSQNRENKNFELRRFRQQDLIYSGLVGLSKLHPMFGEWIGPIAELSRQAEAKRVLEDAKRVLNNWNDDLLPYQRTPKSKD